ncbi:MAG TPA: malic enzyme-like NAD(P)-binding protein [Amycolatopsis sp.]|uniref:malic enzyme-like NAD(P)-binding protein n=1 Tax=Amycolatopsis sp. TaxID=37632 RepID=UPI002B4670CC|nr:malic enzyme-like NAD(P)-binding protein [Amycolatopsis sp.]HKS43966.1 malic enzyme-like NAD(P)-binding protein [Amycolatopsis sp.]
MSVSARRGPTVPEVLLDPVRDPTVAFTEAERAELWLTGRLPRGRADAGAAGRTRLSNPTSRIEAMPEDLIRWSDGKVLTAAGIPVAPVEYDGVRYTIEQANNALFYPGLGLGTIMAGARKVTPGTLPAEAVAGQVDTADPGAALLPPVKNLHASSAAVAVVRATLDEDVASREIDKSVAGRAGRHVVARPVVTKSPLRTR